MKTSYSAAFAVALALLFTAPPRARSQDAAAPAKLKVHVNYTGAGTVDESTRYTSRCGTHPNLSLAANVTPVAIQSTTSKDGSVTFAT